MKSFKRTATISKRSPGILLRVPRGCTNGSEEVFHRCFIAIEQLAVEVTWVPIDYHATKIEDCDRIFCHCKYILSSRGNGARAIARPTKSPHWQSIDLCGGRFGGYLATEEVSNGTCNFPVMSL